VNNLFEVTDIEQELKSRAGMGKGGSEAYDNSDDDDEHPRGQRVQCAQS
jgi:DnaJ family protein A protein 2